MTHTTPEGVVRCQLALTTKKRSDVAEAFDMSVKGFRGPGPGSYLDKPRSTGAGWLLGQADVDDLESDARRPAADKLG